MWRKINPKQSQVEFVKAAFSGYGIHSFLSDLLILPLLPFFLASIWVIGLDWKLLLIIPIAVLCILEINQIRLFHRTSKIIEEIKKLYDEKSDWQYRNITTEEYLETLYQDSLISHNESDEQNEQEFARSMLTEAEYHLGNYLRFIVVESSQDSVLGVLATFAIPKRAWIFLDRSPSEMDGLAHFNVLHEVGHTSIAYSTNTMFTKGDITTYLISFTIIAVMVTWDYTTLVISLIFLVTYVSLREGSYKWFRKRLRYYEELNADDFALQRLPQHWLKNFTTDEDIEAFADMICSNLSTDNHRKDSHSKYDEPMSEEQVKWRKIIIINKINRKLKGEQYKPIGYVPGCASFLMNKLILIQHIILLALLTLLGLQQAELTWLRFFGLIFIMLLIIFFGLVFEKLSESLPDYWDKLILSMEVPTSRQNDMDFFIKGIKWREDFDKRRWKKLEEREKEKDKYIDVNFTPPGVTEILFQPDELDIHVNKVTFESYIFHGKVIDYNISHLEYYAQNHSIVVVMNDGRRFDLGVILPWLVRPYFLKAKEVKIVRTENRVSVDKVIVPLRKGI